MVSIDGLARLGGTLYADFGSGADPAEGLYRVLTATGGLSGSFSVLSNLDLTQYSIAAVYGTDYVDLQVSRRSPLLLESAAALPMMAPVPEPQTYALMLAGLILVLWRRKQRRDAAR